MDRKFQIGSYYKTYPYNNKLINMNKIIERIFLNYGIIVSSIYISEYRKHLIFHFHLYISHSCQYNIIKNILKLIQSLFVLKYNKNISFDINISKSIYYDDKLISS